MAAVFVHVVLSCIYQGKGNLLFSISQNALFLFLSVQAASLLYSRSLRYVTIAPKLPSPIFGLGQDGG